TRLLIPGYEVQRDVVAGDRQRPSVRRKGQAPDALFRANGMGLFTRCRLPKIDRFVRAAFEGDEDAAVWREQRTSSEQLALAALAGGHFPKTHYTRRGAVGGPENFSQQLAVR